MKFSRLAWVLPIALMMGNKDCYFEELPPPTAEPNPPPADQVERGRKVWFEDTFGGEKFFKAVETGLVFGLPLIPEERRLKVAFDRVAATPRAERFARWGVINDPDCVEDPDDLFDRCPNPEATGVVGARKIRQPDGSYLIGLTCASCHAGFDPLHPPADPANPSWENIHPTIGNQHLRMNDIFSGNLAENDPRKVLFDAWPPGTVDTTLLFDDHIVNPGVVSAFWEHTTRPRFPVTRSGQDTGLQLRNGQGGEDDVGGQLAAIRVYTNIGVCFEECTALPYVLGYELDVASCKTACKDFPSDQKLDDLVAFLSTFRSPNFPGQPAETAKYDRGARVFAANCVSCHDDQGNRRNALTTDQIKLFVDDSEVTNTCRALSTNWDRGKLWAQFSSDQFKDRTFLAGKGYRAMPIAGAWATTPFLHNQSVGDWAPATASPEERVPYFRAAMLELLSANRAPKIYRTPRDLDIKYGFFPAGTPVSAVFSRDPNTNALLCDDPIENRGHTFGGDLSDADKDALIYWLLYQ